MAKSVTPWWKALQIRKELISASGQIDDVQMSLFQAVHGIAAAQPPHADAAYYGSITHLTERLVDLLTEIAIRIGGGSDYLKARTVTRLDQAWVAVSRMHLSARSIRRPMRSHRCRSKSAGRLPPTRRADSAGRPPPIWTSRMSWSCRVRQHDPACAGQGARRPCRDVVRAIPVVTARRGLQPVRVVSAVLERQGQDRRSASAGQPVGADHRRRDARLHRQRSRWCAAQLARRNHPTVRCWSRHRSIASALPHQRSAVPCCLDRSTRAPRRRSCGAGRHRRPRRNVHAAVANDGQRCREDCGK